MDLISDITSGRGICAIGFDISLSVVHPGNMEIIQYSHFFVGFSIMTGAPDAHHTNLSNFDDIHCRIPS